MPLPYDVTEPLQLPRGHFNADAIAVITIQGGRYGGHWVINAFADDPNETVGRIDTCYDLQRADLTKDERYPQLATDTALIWLNDETKRRGWRLLTWDSFNDRYGPDEKPFFMAARALIGSENFVPSGGVQYLDDVLARGTV